MTLSSSKRLRRGAPEPDEGTGRAKVRALGHEVRLMPPPYVKASLIHT